jgi:signal transduction histidine kinase
MARGNTQAKTPVAGSGPPATEVIDNPTRVRGLFLDLVKGSKESVLLLMPSAAAFQQDEGLNLASYLESASSRGASVNLMCPSDPDLEEKIDSTNRSLKRRGAKEIEYDRIFESTAPDTVTLLVADGAKSLVFEQDPMERSFLKAIGVGTYSNRTPTVRANRRIFARLKEEISLREREESLLKKEMQSRKQAELLQDILAHDIRNFNQISRTSAEMLREMYGKGRALPLIDRIIKAVDGSSELIERTKKLAKIISVRDMELKEVDLEESIKRSLSLIEKANPSKEIRASVSLPGRSKVVADDLLDDVFTNILSNAVKYTSSARVPIEIKLEETPATKSKAEGVPRRGYLKVSISDRGKGIPDSLKDKVFTRYHEAASGSGLGLSIVHALVVDRYSGLVQISNRLKNDSTKGTIVEIWLPKSQ